MKTRHLLVASVLVGTVLTGCGGDDTSAATTVTTTSAPAAPATTATTTPATTATATATTTTRAAATTTVIPDDGAPVTFETIDGLTLEGRRFGSGDDFVILAHMLPASMESWFDFAALLAAEGYTAIAFNFRGYGDSDGEGFSVSTDLTAAFDYAIESGAARVFAIGASMGGTGSLASTEHRSFAGVASLSAPIVFERVDAMAGATASTAPLLLIAAEGDTPYPADAATIASVHPDAEVIILGGSQHGTNLFIDHGEALEDALLEFLSNQT